jgi:hypothetical protein
MSCSDKLCRWNCVGLQGGLLSRLLPAPIYLSSVTTGDSRGYHHGAMSRAMCCRLAAVTLAPPYVLHHPQLLVVRQHSITLQPGKHNKDGSRHIGLCWVPGPRPADVFEHGRKVGVELGANKTPKSTLCELAQARGWGVPIFRCTAETGPSHAPEFEVEVVVVKVPVGLVVVR